MDFNRLDATFVLSYLFICLLNCQTHLEVHSWRLCTEYHPRKGRLYELPQRPQTTYHLLQTTTFKLVINCRWTSIRLTYQYHALTSRFLEDIPRPQTWHRRLEPNTLILTHHLHSLIELDFSVNYFRLWLRKYCHVFKIY